MSRYQAENTDIWEDKFRREYQAHQELKEKYNTQVELCKKLEVTIRRFEGRDRSRGSTDHISANDNGVEVNELLLEQKKLTEKLKKLQLKCDEKDEIIKKLKAENSRLLRKRNIVKGRQSINPNSEDIIITAGSRQHINSSDRYSENFHETQVNDILKSPSVIVQISSEQRAEYEKIISNLTRALEDLRYQKELSDARACSLPKLQEQLIELRQSSQNVDTNLFNQLHLSEKRVSELKRALEDLMHEKDKLEVQVRTTRDLQEQIIELRHINTNLEERIAKLCESPFMKDTLKLNDSKKQLEDLKKERDQLLITVDHLREAVRTNYSALTALKHDIVKVRDENESLMKANEDYRLKCSQLETDGKLLESKLKQYCGDDGIDLGSLERALTLVRRNVESFQKPEFLEKTSATQYNSDMQEIETENERFAIPLLRKKLEDTQIKNIKLSEEVEKLESMLKLQTSINRNLHTELDMATHKKDNEILQLQNDIRIHEERNKKREDKIMELKAQLREFKYPLHSSRSASVGSNISIEDYEYQSKALRDSFESNNGELEINENLLEVWIKSARFNNGILAANSGTFVIISNFYDYTAQATPIISGQKPLWDFAAVYKFKMDATMLPIFNGEIKFEIMHAKRGESIILSKINIPLSTIPKVEPRIQIKNYPMYMEGNQTVIIGYIDIELLLALPIQELFNNLEKKISK